MYQAVKLVVTQGEVSMPHNAPLATKNTHLPQTPIKDTVRVYALGFDGCLFNTVYEALFDAFSRGQFDGQPIIEANRAAFDREIAAISQSSNISQVIFTVFSDRQDASYDKHQSLVNQTESCFKALKTICQYFNKHLTITASVFALLSPDALHGLPMGTTYQKALMTQSSDHADLIAQHDPSKVSLVYLFSHALSRLYPSSLIEFMMIDNNIETFEAIFKYYATDVGLQLLPSNVALQAHVYTLTMCGTEDHVYHSAFKGTGYTDGYFNKTMVAWANASPKTETTVNFMGYSPRKLFTIVPQGQKLQTLAGHIKRKSQQGKLATHAPVWAELQRQIEGIESHRSSIIDGYREMKRIVQGYPGCTGLPAYSPIHSLLKEVSPPGSPNYTSGPLKRSFSPANTGV